MWRDNAGFGKMLVVNKLEAFNTNDCAATGTTHVHGGTFTKLRLTGFSTNTLSGEQRPVHIDLLTRRRQVGPPGTREQVSLSWKKLFGPPVPNSWGLDYEISAPGNEQSQVFGRIPFQTPHGERPMAKITFRYVQDAEGDAWYSFETEHFDWMTNTWTSDSINRIGNSPAARPS